MTLIAPNLFLELSAFVFLLRIYEYVPFLRIFVTPLAACVFNCNAVCKLTDVFETCV
jgi:hypothetical protein